MKNSSHPLHLPLFNSTSTLTRPLISIPGRRSSPLAPLQAAAKPDPFISLHCRSPFISKAKISPTPIPSHHDSLPSTTSGHLFTSSPRPPTPQPLTSHQSPAITPVSGHSSIPTAQSPPLHPTRNHHLCRQHPGEARPPPLPGRPTATQGEPDLFLFFSLLVAPISAATPAPLHGKSPTFSSPSNPRPDRPPHLTTKPTRPLLFIPLAVPSLKRLLRPVPSPI